jgi:hypothetical protein
MSTQLVRYLRHCITTILVVLCHTTGAAAQAVWFDPWAPPNGPKDYMALFQPNAPWQRAASAVKVFEIPDELVFSASPGDLGLIVADLRRRHIDLGVGVAPLLGRGPGKCGYHVEGYGGPGGPHSLALHLTAVGATPRYFGMDEPLYFGHVFDRGRDNFGCRLSIPEVARDVATSVRQVRSVFPNVRFGDVEPLTFYDQDPWFRSGAWFTDLSAWFDAYEAAAGDKLAYFRIDTWWTPHLSEQMPALSRLLNAKGIPLQIIYNGSGQDKTDSAWIASAVSHFKRFESGNWPLPDAVAIQFWTPHPSRILPETDPLTATGLIDQYLDWQQTRPHR